MEGFFGKAFIDPYLSYRLGNVLVSMRTPSRNVRVSVLRNMAQFNTNVPSFYRVEEPAVFPRMRCEGFLCLSGGLGGGPCSPRLSFHVRSRSRKIAHARRRSRGARCAVLL